MHRALVFIITAMLLFSTQFSLSKTIYTWTDKDGVVHITETKPPAGAQLTDKIIHKSTPARNPPEIEKHKVNERKAAMLVDEARRKAQRSRRAADKAKKEMEAAIEEANRIKADTDAFIRQWGIQSRHRKSLRAKIVRRQEAANQSVAEADRLRTIATEAEAKAQAAEKELEDLMQVSRESIDYTRNLEAETPAADASPE